MAFLRLEGPTFGAARLSDEPRRLVEMDDRRLRSDQKIRLVVLVLSRWSNAGSGWAVAFATMRPGIGCYARLWLVQGLRFVRL